jgi:hypothetical protein
MRLRQLSLLPRVRLEHGGERARGRRKVRRPFDPKRPVHLTLRSSRARGAWSMLRPRHRAQVLHQLQRMATKRDIRIYRFANVGNHLHLLVQAGSLAAFQAFLREFSGRVAAAITGSVKGRPQKFWDHLAWSKVVEWGRQYRAASRYILLNVLEGSGLRDHGLLARLEREGVLRISAEPP